MNLTTDTKIYIKLESFNHEILTSSCQKLVNILQTAQVNSFGVVSLPTKKRIYCVLRSPHVDKDSREHFEIRVHKKIIKVSCPLESLIFDRLSNTNLPTGVCCKIRID